MNAAERIVDRLHPRISAELRLVKSRRAGDPILRVIDGLVGPGDTVVDIGARRGVYTIRLAKLVGPTGRVHVIEPFPPNAAGLGRLRLRNAPVHPVALSEQAGEATFYVPVRNGVRLDALASLTPPDGVDHEALVVEVQTLDELLADEAAVSFVKCDAEGHELSVLKGAKQLLMRSALPPLTVRIEQRHQQQPIERTFEYLTQLGYAGFYLTRDGGRPLEQFDVGDHQLRFLTGEFVPGPMPSGYVNIFLFVRDRAQASRLLGRDD